LIMEKLNDVASNKIGRMVYNNFDETITAKHGIVLENWPLPKFCNPSSIGSRTEINVVYQAFRSGAARFRKLSNEEWKQWEEERFQAKFDSMGGPGDESGDDTAAPTAREVCPTDDTSPAAASPAATSPTAAPSTAVPSAAAPSVSVPSTCTASASADSSVAVNVDGASTSRQCADDSHDGPDADTTVPRKRRKTAAQPLQTFVNAVGDPTGGGLVIPKRTRKERSDKGTKRGPRKDGARKENVTAATGPSGATS